MIETRVLLVDDDQDDYLLTGDLLREIQGGSYYRLDWVDDYEAGLKMLESNDHEICLLDYRLGTKSGIDFLHEAVLRGCTVPIILLTGQGTGALEADALAAGATDYLVKGRTDADSLWRALRLAAERNKALEAMRERDRLFRAIFDGAVDGMLISDNTGRYVDANPAATELTGLSREELLRKCVGDIVADSMTDVGAAWEAFLSAGKQSGEFELHRTDGHVRRVEFAAAANILPGRHLSLLRDVTDRRNEEETRLRLATIVESTNDVVVGIDLQDRITSWNASAEKILGYSPADILGQPYEVLVPENRREEYSSLINRLNANEPIRNHETTRRHKDGRTIDVSLTLSVNRDRNGVVNGRSSIARDITEPKAMRMRLAISDRMASVGTLAAGIAHEINNPLAAALSNMHYASRLISDTTAEKFEGDIEELQEVLRESLESAERVKSTVRDLKLFSRVDEEVLGPVQVNAVIESSLRMARNEIRHRARVVTDFGSVPAVDASDSRLGQVVLNLLVNAAHAITRGSVEENEVRITTREEGGRVLIEIRDTGSGIPADKLPLIFEPFFTTKPVGVGTGLGLSICHGIITGFGGHISVESTVGVGTMFTVSLPVGKTTAATAPVPSQSTHVRARVLVIDDEPLVIRSIMRLLADHHVVETTSSAREALSRIGAGDEFDVILCDLMMPDMTGMDLYEQLESLSPRMAGRVAFCTGGGVTERAKAFIEQWSSRIVDKPFDETALLTVIREIVAGARD